MTNLQFYKTESAARAAFMKRHANGGSYCETCIMYNIAPNGGKEDCFRWWKNMRYVVPVKNACKSCTLNSMCDRKGDNVEQCELRTTSFFTAILEFPRSFYGRLKSMLNTAMLSVSSSPRF